jgi:hypothetical protein
MILKLTVLAAFIISVTSFFPFTKTTETIVETVISGVRGVPKYSQILFEKESFTCDGDTKSYTKSEVNDGYCDCVDGRYCIVYMIVLSISFIFVVLLSMFPSYLT